MISSWYVLAVLVLGALGWGYAYGDDNCYHDFQVTTDKQMYKPGDVVIMTFKSAAANCEPKNAPFLLSVINQTGGASDIVYQKMLVYNPGGMIFNYTLPQASSLPVFDRYSIKTEANSTSGPAEAHWDIFVKENAPDQNYDFQIWPFQSAVARGSHIFIMAQLCPIPNTDQGLEPIVDKKTGLITVSGSDVLVNYYFTGPNGTQIIRQDGMGNAECYNSQASGDLFSNTTGTWSVYAVAKWIENNSTHTLQSKTVNFTVKQPLTTGQVTKLVSLDELKKMIVSEYDPTYDWHQLVVHITGLNWAQNKIILRAENPYSGPDLLWSIGTDGNGLKRIYSNDTLLENLRHPPNDLGDITVWVPQFYKSPSFTIMLGTLDNSYQQVLYNANSTPEYPAISSDGRYIVFASEASSSWDNPKEDGIYLVILSTPVPEFPFTIPVLLIGITSLIVFYRMKFRK